MIGFPEHPTDDKREQRIDVDPAVLRWVQCIVLLVLFALAVIGLAKAGTLGKAKAKASARKYVMPDPDKPEAVGPTLLEAVGRLVAFTPASARRYLAQHPDEIAKLKPLISSARNVIDAVIEEIRKSNAPVVVPKSEQSTFDREVNRTSCAAPSIS